MSFRVNPQRFEIFDCFLKNIIIFQILYGHLYIDSLYVNAYFVPSIFWGAGDNVHSLTFISLKPTLQLQFYHIKSPSFKDTKLFYCDISERVSVTCIHVETG